MTNEPGWYPDPRGGGGLRWWDGEQWTDRAMPPADEPEERGAKSWHYAAAVVIAVVIPLLGLIIGAVWIGEGGRNRSVGIVCVALSAVAMLVLWQSLWLTTT